MAQSADRGGKQRRGYEIVAPPTRKNASRLDRSEILGVNVWMLTAFYIDYGGVNHAWSMKARLLPPLFFPRGYSREEKVSEATGMQESKYAALALVLPTPGFQLSVSRLSRDKNL